MRIGFSTGVDRLAQPRIPPVPTSLLIESGNSVLLESGDKILLES